MRLLSPTDYRTMPWKNGLGITREIAALRSAEDQASGRFAWRLSMADVTASAPFSPFPGCDRVIVLLSGDGMLLHSDEGGSHRLDQPLLPYAFSGDVSTDCRLLGGACRDFNVMVDRARAQAAVHVVTLSSQTQTVAAAGSTLALFVASGRVHVHGDSGAGPPGITIPAGHTLLWNRADAEPLPERLALLATDEPACVFLVWLRLHEAGSEPTTPDDDG